MILFVLCARHDAGMSTAHIIDGVSSYDANRNVLENFTEGGANIFLFCCMLQNEFICFWTGVAINERERWPCVAFSHVVSV